MSAAAAAAGGDECHLRIHNGLSLLKGSEIYAVQRDPVNHVDAIFEIDEEENEETMPNTLLHAADVRAVAPTRQKSCGGESEHKERINPQAYLHVSTQYADRTLRWCRSDDISLRNSIDTSLPMTQKEIIHIDTAPMVRSSSAADSTNAVGVGANMTITCAAAKSASSGGSAAAAQATIHASLHARVQGAPFAAYVFSDHPNKIALLYKSLISQDGTGYKSGDLVYVKHSAFVPDATQQYKPLKSHAWGEIVAFVELFTCERYEHASQNKASAILSLSKAKGGGSQDGTPLTDNEIANGILITDMNELGMHVNRSGRKCVRSSIQLLFNWGLYPSDLKAYYPDLEDIYKGMPKHNKYSRFLSNYEQIVSVKAIESHMPMKDAKNITDRFNVNTSEVESFSFSETARRSHAVAHTNINPLQYILNSIACDKELMDAAEIDKEHDEPSETTEHRAKKQKTSSASAAQMHLESTTKGGHSDTRSRRKRTSSNNDDPDYLEEDEDEAEREGEGEEEEAEAEGEIFVPDTDDDEGGGGNTTSSNKVAEEEEKEERKQTDCASKASNHASCKGGVPPPCANSVNEREHPRTGAAANSTALLEHTGLRTGRVSAEADALNHALGHPQAVSSRKRRRCVEDKEPNSSQNSEDASFVVDDSQDTADSGNNEQSISLDFVPRHARQDDAYTVNRNALLFQEAVFWNPTFLQHAPFWKKYVEDKFQFYQQLSCNNQELSVLNALISNMWKMDSYHIRATDGSCCFCKLRRSLTVAVILPMHGQTTNYAGACCFEKVKKVVTFVQIFEKYRERLLLQYHAFTTPNVLSMAQFQKAIMPHVWKTEFTQFETELSDALRRLNIPNFA